MGLTREQMYERMRANDASFDGKFFVGVLTTGIYCLPSCRARLPKLENVRFFETEQAAVAFGLRPCKRCRPEQLGLNLEERRLEELVCQAEETPSAFKTIEEFTVRRGCGASKLNEDFRRHYHATPLAVLTRSRMTYAMRALLDTDAPIGEIALDAGFEALSAFYENFRRTTGLTPQEYRLLRSAPCFAVVLPEGFDVPRWRRYLERDSESLSERAKAGAFLFAVELADHFATIRLSIREGQVRCEIEDPRLAASAHRWLVRKLGLNQDVRGFESLMSGKPEGERLLVGGRALRIPQTGTVWEGLVWSIVGQQVNFQFAATLKRRITEVAGTKLASGLVALPNAPQIAQMEPRELQALQFSARKAEYLIGAARAVASGELPVEDMPLMPASKVERMLLARSGIGPWSANYLMMRACGFMDCTPLGDTGLTSGLQTLFNLETRPDQRATIELMRRFAPYRSLATYHLWNLLSDSR